MTEIPETRERLERTRDTALTLFYGILSFAMLLLIIPLIIVSVRLVGVAMHGLPCP